VIILIVDVCAVRVNATDLENASKLFFIFVEEQGLQDLFPSLHQMIYKLSLLYKTCAQFNNTKLWKRILDDIWTHHLKMFILNLSSKSVLCNAKKTVFDWAVVITVWPWARQGKDILYALLSTSLGRCGRVTALMLVTLAPFISYMPCYFTPRERTSMCPGSSQGAVQKNALYSCRETNSITLVIQLYIFKF